MDGWMDGGKSAAAMVHTGVRICCVCVLSFKKRNINDMLKVRTVSSPESSDKLIFTLLNLLNNQI